jgi:hypothetical protein
VSELAQYSAKLEGRVSELERDAAEREARAERTAREVEETVREVREGLNLREDGGSCPVWLRNGGSPSSYPRL